MAKRVVNPKVAPKPVAVRPNLGGRGQVAGPALTPEQIAMVRAQRAAAANVPQPRAIPTFDVAVPGQTMSSDARLAPPAVPAPFSLDGVTAPPRPDPAAWRAPMVLPGTAAPAPNANHSSVFGKGPMGPPAPVVPESPIDKLRALLPELNLDTYTKPFDDASTAARTAAEDAIPDIQQMYAQLRQQLGAGQADTSGQLAKQRADLVQGGDSLVRDVTQRAADTQADLRANGVDNGALISGYGAEMEARRAGATQAADSRVALADRIAQIGGQDAASRVADSRLAETSAGANVKANLAELLNKVGLGRAGAEQQFNKDSANRELSLFGAQQKQAESDAKQATERVKMLKDAAVTPRQLFERDYAQTASQYPQAVKAFEEIIGKVKGKGPMASAQAQRALDAWASDLKSGKGEIKDAKGVVTAKIGARVNPAILRSWLEAYYDDQSQTIDPRMAAALGG